MWLLHIYSKPQTLKDDIQFILFDAAVPVN